MVILSPILLGYFHEVYHAITGKVAGFISGFDFWSTTITALAISHYVLKSVEILDKKTGWTRLWNIIRFLLSLTLLPFVLRKIKAVWVFIVNLKSFQEIMLQWKEDVTLDIAETKLLNKEQSKLQLLQANKLESIEKEVKFNGGKTTTVNVVKGMSETLSEMNHRQIGMATDVNRIINRQDDIMWNNPVPTYIIDKKGWIVYINKAYGELFDVELDHVAGMGWLTAIVPPEDVNTFEKAHKLRYEANELAPVDKDFTLMNYKNNKIRITVHAESVIRKVVNPETHQLETQEIVGHFTNIRTQTLP